MACHSPPLEKAKKQVEMALPMLSPIPFIIVENFSDNRNAYTSGTAYIAGKRRWALVYHSPHTPTHTNSHTHYSHVFNFFRLYN